MPMNPRQKRIVFVLVAANLVVILGLVLWISQALNPASTVQGGGTATASVGPVVPTDRGASMASSPEPTGPAPSLPPASSEACQWRAAQLLTGVGLDGAVSVSGDTLRFDIAYPLAPGQTVDEAAQAVWPAFDVALALMEEACGSFSQIEVVVLAQGSQTVRTSAQVSAEDLVAFAAGEMSEDAFIQRVTYQVDLPGQ
jgi:hypothetical protein